MSCGLQLLALLASDQTVRTGKQSRGDSATRRHPGSFGPVLRGLGDLTVVDPER
jgi:hypothetical protein